MDYKAKIKNVSAGTWLNEVFDLTSNENEALVFTDKEEANAMLEAINKEYLGGFILIDENRQTKSFPVTYSVCGTMIIEAENEEEAREIAKSMTKNEILEYVSIAIDSDGYVVGDVYEDEDYEDMEGF